MVFYLAQASKSALLMSSFQLQCPPFQSHIQRQKVAEAQSCLILVTCGTGTPFMVDGFAFQSSKCAHYFLTHYHADHTIGAL